MSERESLPVYITIVTEIWTGWLCRQGFQSVRFFKIAASVHNFVTCTHFHGKGPNASNAIQG